MIAAQAALWGKAAIATAVDLRKRVRVALVELRRIQIALTTWVLEKSVAAMIGTRATLGRYGARTRDAIRCLTEALNRHRHGTWLLLFGVLFTLLWLLAGWAGLANGLWRCLLVGIATPAAVHALFPLRRPVPSSPPPPSRVAAG